jgi:PAS domain-containing protein
MLATEATERVLRDVVDAVESGKDDLFAALDVISAPLYVTDASGVLTYYNPACVGFAGRTPAVGKDQWCVTWKLYANDGSFLPHSE